MFIKHLLSFYHFSPDSLVHLSYHKTTKAISILKVLEHLLKRIQSGKLSIKNANKFLQKETNMFLSQNAISQEIVDSSQPSREQLNFGSLQIDFFETLSIMVKEQTSQDLKIKQLGDINLGMCLVRLYDYLLDLKNFVTAVPQWDSEYYEERFGGVKEMGMQDKEKQQVLEMFNGACFDLGYDFFKSPVVFSINNPFFNQRFFSFRKIKRYFKIFLTFSLTKCSKKK
jgi:hypothetical protein